jgi:hypothetical protein
VSLITMPSRTRSRTRASVAPGSYVITISGSYGAGPYYGASGVGWQETCDDSTQPVPYVNDQPFTGSNRQATALRVWGEVSFSFAANWHVVYQGYNPENMSLASYCPEPTPFDWVYWQTKALANMNPNRPTVDLPLFLYELKDFPRMLRDAGHLLKVINEGGMKLVKQLHPREVANAHLAYSFGWAPLVSDLLSLFNLSKSIEDRKAYFRSLERGTRVRRGLRRGEIARSISSNGYAIAASGEIDLMADVQFTEKLRVWFTANAKLMTKLPDASELQSLTEETVLGLNVSAATFWEAIPWSWLIDYFANIGDLMAATRGNIPWQATRMNLMATSEVETKLVNVRLRPGMTRFTGGVLKNTVKRRYVSTYPTPSLSYDRFLSGGQMAILGSLLTARSLKGIA